jgi:hypothetical protein
VAARDEARQRTGEVLRRRLPDEGPAAGARLDDAEELERAQRLADGGARDLELLGQLALRRKLIARPEVALLEKTLDLLDDPLVEPAASDGLDYGQFRLLSAVVRWSDQRTTE